MFDDDYREKRIQRLRRKIRHILKRSKENQIRRQQLHLSENKENYDAYNANYAKNAVDRQMSRAALLKAQRNGFSRETYLKKIMDDIHKKQALAEKKMNGRSERMLSPKERIRLKAKQRQQEYVRG